MTILGITMNELIQEQVRKNGLVVILLASGLWYMEKRTQDLEQRVFDCYENNQTELIRVIEGNTQAIKDLQDEVRKI